MAAGAHTLRREEQATLSVRNHALAALMERLGEEGEVEALVSTLAAQTARGTLAASQAGALIAARVLGGGAPLRLKGREGKMSRPDVTFPTPGDRRASCADPAAGEHQRPPRGAREARACGVACPNGKRA